MKINVKDVSAFCVKLIPGFMIKYYYMIKKNHLKLFIIGIIFFRNSLHELKLLLIVLSQTYYQIIKLFILLLFMFSIPTYLH